MKKRLLDIALAAMAAMAPLAADAQEFRTGTLYVNEDVTTFILSGEAVLMMDISVPDSVLAGNLPADNIVRLKAVRKAGDRERLGMVTVVGERSIAQFNVVYVADKGLATANYKIRPEERIGYVNREVDMDQETMMRYCRQMWGKKRSYYDVYAKDKKMTVYLNNLYAIGDYFFFDISVENRSNIRFDIEEVRIKLCDKRQYRAANSQDIEIEPVMVLRDAYRFQRYYRNVFVVRKMTFPDEKVLNFTFGEKQISGRTITLSMDYEDVLSADTFDLNVD